MTLTKIALHSAVWVLAFCAVLISPVILIYSVPVVVGAVADVVQAGGGPIAAVLIASGAAYLMFRKALLRAAVPASDA
jgi:hypothetical protein